MNRQPFYAIYAIVVLALSACATTPPPKTFTQSLAYSYGLVASADETIASLVTSGTITPLQARVAVKETDAILSGLNASRELFKAGNIDNAQSKLAAAQSLLATLTEYLKSKQPK